MESGPMEALEAAAPSIKESKLNLEPAQLATALLL